jgi:hypothetical protein
MRKGCDAPPDSSSFSSLAPSFPLASPSSKSIVSQGDRLEGFLLPSGHLGLVRFRRPLAARLLLILISTQRLLLASFEIDARLGFAGLPGKFGKPGEIPGSTSSSQVVSLSRLTRAIVLLGVKFEAFAAASD